MSNQYVIFLKRAPSHNTNYGIQTLDVQIGCDCFRLGTNPGSFCLPSIYNECNVALGHYSVHFAFANRHQFQITTGNWVSSNERIVWHLFHTQDSQEATRDFGSRNIKESWITMFGYCTKMTLKLSCKLWMNLIVL